MLSFRKKRIYADAAAATPLSHEAHTRLVELLTVFGNPGSLHREGVRVKKELEDSRAEAAMALGAHSDELVFTSGGTEGNTLALYGVLRPYSKASSKPHVITSAIEHPSILEPIAALEREGFSVTRLPVTSEGLVVPEVLQKALTEETVLVSIQYVNSEIGSVQDIRALAKVIRDENKRGRKNPILFHVDASQAPLYMSCDVRKLGVDLLTLDGQKILGPKGVGALFVKRGVRLEPLFLGGGQERGLRSGTENVPLIGAFARALASAQKQFEQYAAHVMPIRDALTERILAIVPGSSLNGGREHRIANNVNISIDGIDGELLVIGLDAQGVAASARSACASESGGASHVLLALGLSDRRARSSVRLTLLPDARAADVESIAQALLHTLKRHPRAEQGKS